MAPNEPVSTPCWGGGYSIGLEIGIGDEIEIGLENNV
jgi:hypothetical protein